MEMFIKVILVIVGVVLVIWSAFLGKLLDILKDDEVSKEDKKKFQKYWRFAIFGTIAFVLIYFGICEFISKF